MKFSQTDRVLHAFAVVAFATLILVILFGQTVKDSGPAEWLSAVLNLVMAGAAVAAYLTARSWLPQLTTQEGYKEAIALVNEQYIHLGPFNTLTPAAEKVMKAFQKHNETIAGDAVFPDEPFFGSPEEKRDTYTGGIIIKTDCCDIWI